MMEDKLGTVTPSVEGKKYILQAQNCSLIPQEKNKRK